MKQKKAPSMQAAPVQQPPRKEKGRVRRAIFKCIRRFFLVLFALIIMLISVVLSALIDSASFFDRFPIPRLPGSATLLSVICVAIGIRAILFNKKQ